MTSYLCKYSSSRHEDSAGHKGTIEAGGVQWMCAVRQIPISPFPFFLTKIEFLSFFSGTWEYVLLFISHHKIDA